MSCALTVSTLCNMQAEHKELNHMHLGQPQQVDLTWMYGPVGDQAKRHRWQNRLWPVTSLPADRAGPGDRHRTIRTAESTDYGWQKL